ncbi:MAG: hypothetical protein ABI837_19220 [Acidobacteriota bacterium]
MKNQYFGDVNDWRKFYILRTLLAAGVKLTIGWMLTPDDGSSNGSRLDYLSGPAQGSADRELFDWFRAWNGDGAVRQVSLIEDSGLLAGAGFVRDPLGDSSSERDRWFEKLAAMARGTSLIFLDPDNGLEIKSVRRGARSSSKYVYWDEIRVLLEQGFSVLVYQHVPRIEPGRATHIRVSEAYERLPIKHCVSIRAVGVNYFLFPAENAAGGLIPEAVKCTNNQMGVDVRYSSRAEWGTLFALPEPLKAKRPAPRISKAGITTAIGFVNRNGQAVREKTDLAGTDHGQKVYVLQCNHCTFEYGVNGSGIFQYRCPNCQTGVPGIPYR